MEFNLTQNEAGREVDSKSGELIAEFRAHLNEIQRRHPEMIDEGKIFEGWAIQKIAGLQVVVLKLSEHIKRLEGRIAR